MSRPVGRGLPRAVDAVLAGTALVALTPLLAILAVLVAATSRGGVLYVQTRVGRGGRLFPLFKFRSMRVQSSATAQFEPGDRSRITPVGAFLRRHKLDELPQLLNVLRGDMAVVGPRPEVPEWVATYTEEQRGVLAVRPGLTGPSQLAYRAEESLLAAAADPVRAYREEILPAKLALDLDYVSTRTVAGDIRLIGQTLGALLRRS